MKILVVGDVVGSSGRNTLKAYLDKYKNNYDFIVVNGENSAGGFGITSKIADEFFSWGVDVITSGNHIWDKKEIYDYLDKTKKLLRPYNYPKNVPGNGYIIAKDRQGRKIAVVSLQGRVFMPAIDCPFVKGNELIDELRKECMNIIIDIHAEATSEKLALAHYLDGKVSLVYGTHTHVQTADNKILLDGTGYISDVGMTGSDNGVIGVNKEAIINKFTTALPQKFELAEGKERLNGIDVEIDDETGECKSIERINSSLIELGVFL